MGIANRTFDVTEQKEVYAATPHTVVNAQDVYLGLIPRAQTITDCKIAMNGVSGTPTILLKAMRFVTGTGGSTFLIGSTFAVTTYATSGYLSYSLPAAGSTLLNLQKGDVLLAVQGGGTGAASTDTLIEVVVQNLQDFKSWF